MYAIVEIAGHQYKVQKDQQIYVNRVEGEEGSSITFGRVLLTDSDGTIDVGAPVIQGIQVDAKIVSHLKADKVIVFKKKRRKGYRVKNGHRQAISLIEIIAIGSEENNKKSAPKKAEAKKDDASKKETVSKKETAPKKEASSKETKATAKPASKKTESKEVSENLVTRAEHRVEKEGIDVNVDKLLHNIGTAEKADQQDLKEINGIGPAYEEKLNIVGIYTYQQIANMKVADMKMLSELSGITEDKVKSEEWVKQAKALIKKEEKK